MRHCKICSGRLTLLGRLGSMLWYRCVSCGMEWSKRTDKDHMVFGGAILALATLAHLLGIAS